MTGLTALVLLVGTTGVAVAQEDEPEVIRARVIEISVEPDEAIVFNGRRYAGPIRVSAHRSGVAVVESVSLDDYLAGIQEVPFSWEPEALKAQAIAARTYLAWSLLQGRSAQGQRYGYDICATDACQVYAGIEPSLAEGGARWLAAVQATADEVVTFEGAPIAAYYSSTTGGRTRNVGDVWPDIDLPYLVAVESEGEESPFVEWSWRLPTRPFASVLAEADLIEGELEAVTTTVTEDGGGPWTITIVSSGAEQTVDTWRLRSLLNAAGPRVLGGILPALRDDGRVYPQTVLSPSYTVESRVLPLPGLAGVSGIEIYEVNGRGWGHLVGMSQYGAQAMAKRGATAHEIVAHYYGNLTPAVAPELVPDRVQVALATASAEVGFEGTGPVSVTIDGRQIATEELGKWSMAADAGSISVQVPTGLGLPPRLQPAFVSFEDGRLVLKTELTSAATVEWRLEVDGREVGAFGPEQLDAGLFSVPIPVGGQRVELKIEASNRHGGHTIRLPDMGQPGDR